MLSAQHPVRVRQPDIAGAFFHSWRRRYGQISPGLSAAEVTAAVRCQCRSRRVGWAKNMPPEQVTQLWTRPNFNLTSGVVPLKTDAVSPLPCLDRCPELHRRLEDTHALERNVYPVLDI